MDVSHIAFLDETVNGQSNELWLNFVSAGGGVQCARDKSVCGADDWRRRSHSHRLLGQTGPDKGYSSQGLQGSTRLPQTCWISTVLSSSVLDICNWHSKRLELRVSSPFWISLTICLYGWSFCRQTDGRICSQALASRCMLVHTLSLNLYVQHKVIGAHSRVGILRLISL